MKCKLCNTNDLDNTGSHFITESVARSAVSDDGKKGRNNEIMHSLSIATLGQTFIGREISPEKIEEIKGRKMTDDEIAENENMLIDFNLVCHSCEKKFNPIETEFVTKVLRKKIEKQKDLKYIDLGEKDFKITLLFLIINLWRTSASSKPHFKLSGNNEEVLRQILDDFKEVKIDKILEEIDFTNPLLTGIRFATLYLKNDKGLKSENQIALSSDTKPNFIIINQIAFVVFYEPTRKYDLPQLLKPLTSKNQVNKMTSCQPRKLLIKTVNNKKRLAAIKKTGKSQIKSLDKQIEYIIKAAHLKMYGFEPHRDVYRGTIKAISKIPKKKLNLYEINRVIAIHLHLSGEYYKKYGRSH